MKIELISIGDEILSGRIVNTNVAFISEQLALNGWHVQRHTTLPDDPIQISSGIREAVKRSQIVIVTGGLGPTCDDLTRKALAAIFASDLYYDEVVAADLIRRYGGELLSLEDQATIPSKAKAILNRCGTAPGLFFKQEDLCLFALPGIPYEMQQMFIQDVLPILHHVLDRVEKTHTQNIHVCLCSESLVDPVLRNLQIGYPSLKIGIYPSFGMLTVVFSSRDSQVVTNAIELFRQEFATFIYDSKLGLIEDSLQKWFVAQGKKLAFAESCTGGALAARLTAQSGASDYFLGSMVVYSQELKNKILNVTKNTLAQTGEVSCETVKEMLKGIFENTTADYGIAVSGIAGPSGALENKPVGTVYIAMGQRGMEPDAGYIFLRGDRKTIITVTVNRLLSLLWRKVVFGMSPMNFLK